MAYLEPGVIVTQQFVNALPALALFALPNVVVGPVYQVKSRAASGTYSGALITVSYGGKMVGTFVDTRTADPEDLTAYPVKVELKNAIVEIEADTDGEVLVANLNQFTDATALAFQYVLAGDSIVIATGANAGTYTVRQKIDNNTLQINETFAAAEATIGYSIRRNIGADGTHLDVTSASGVVIASTGVTVPAALTTTVTGPGSVPILSASIVLSYRALREDKSADVFEYADASALQADFGIDQIVPENVAVFGAYLALNNAVTKTHLLALDRNYLTDEVLSYSNAYSVLALTDMYAISVMTQNTAVHTTLKTHVEGMSEPLQKKERVGIINRRLVTKSTVVDTKTDGVASGANFTSATSSFITSSVVPGMFIVIGSSRYQIASVVSQTKVTLASNPSAGSGISFHVEKDLQKSEQAAVIAAYAASLGSRRLVLTWPDIVKCPVGNAVRQLPGYFLNCAVGALTTGLPTQQGFTNLGVSVFVGVVHSTKYFDTEQLNIIADGGVMIFVQDVLDQTPLYIRHQLTTDRSAVKFQEFSVTKNVDFIAKFIRDAHKNFIGKYNIVDSTFDELKSMAAGIITFLSENTVRPKIGGVIKSGSLSEIKQDLVNIDRILERYTLDIPIPLNGLDITVVV